jgi:hypothetical protein
VKLLLEESNLDPT